MKTMADTTEWITPGMLCLNATRNNRYRQNKGEAIPLFIVYIRTGKIDRLCAARARLLLFQLARYYVPVVINISLASREPRFPDHLFLGPAGGQTNTFCALHFVSRHLVYLPYLFSLAAHFENFFCKLFDPLEENTLTENPQTKFVSE